MGIGDMIGIVSAIIGMTVAYPALLLLVNIAFSKSTNTSANRLNRGTTLPFIVGLVSVVVGGIVVVVLLSIGSVAQFVGALLLLILLFWATLGIAAIARVVGHRIAAMNDNEFAPLKEMAIGGFVLSLSFGFPLVGWFVMVPLSITLGLGLTVTSFFRRRPRPTPEQPPFKDQSVFQV